MNQLNLLGRYHYFGIFQLVWVPPNSAWSSGDMAFSRFLVGHPVSGKYPIFQRNLESFWRFWWPKSGFYPYGGFLSHGGTPSYHLFTDGFSTINYKLSILWYPHLWKTHLFGHWGTCWRRGWSSWARGSGSSAIYTWVANGVIIP